MTTLAALAIVGLLLVVIAVIVLGYADRHTRDLDGTYDPTEER